MTTPVSIRTLAPESVNPRWWAWEQSGEMECPGNRNASFIIWSRTQWNAFFRAFAYDPNRPVSDAMHEQFDCWLATRLPAAQPERKVS